MKLTFHQIDAFANQMFEGNPAAVFFLEEWLDDRLLQDIAMENNLAETAFLVRRADEGEGHYQLRWFTPAIEVDLCGHATLASAHALWMHHGATAATLNFHTRSGVLRVTRDDSGLMEMDFPSQAPTPAADTSVFETMLGFLPQDCLTAGRYAFAVLGSEADIGALDYDRINFQAAEDGGLLAALIATAPAKSTSEVDCVTRFFAPYAGIPEDPVTGSIHTSVVPYWSKRLGKKDVVAYQASKRGGLLHCTDLGDRVLLRGRCADYMEAIVSLP